MKHYKGIDMDAYKEKLIEGYPVVTKPVSLMFKTYIMLKIIMNIGNGLKAIVNVAFWIWIAIEL